MKATYGRWVGRATLATVLTAVATAAAATRPQELVVSTDKGFVEGFREGNVEKFLGIPYAAPPVGARRWAPPAPAASWHGVRSATVYGNRCAQLASGNGPRSE